MNFDSAELLFWEGCDALLITYAALKDAVLARWPGSETLVQKSQITFRNPHPYCWMSRQGKRFVVSFVHAQPLRNTRIWQMAEPYPGRFMHHLLLAGPQDVDEELLGFIDESRRLRNRLPS